MHILPLSSLYTLPIFYSYTQSTQTKEWCEGTEYTSHAIPLVLCRLLVNSLRSRRLKVTRSVLPTHDKA